MCESKSYNAFFFLPFVKEKKTLPISCNALVQCQGIYIYFSKMPVYILTNVIVSKSENSNP